MSTKNRGSVWSNNECLTAFNRFYDEFKKAYNLAFPLIKVKKKYKNQAPWVEDGLRISIIKKNKLYKNSKIHPTVFNKNEYSKYRNRLSKILKTQQKRYYENLIRENQNNLAKTWNIIKTVLNRRINLRNHLNLLQVLEISRITMKLHVILMNTLPTLDQIWQRIFHCPQLVSILFSNLLTLIACI